MKKGRGLAAYTGVVIAYLFIPIAIMILFGFNDPVGRFNFAWQGFTLDWYRRLFEIEDLTEALRNSLLAAAVATVISTILGSLMALALTRYRFRGRGLMNVFIFLPMATPEIVMGVSLLGLFVTLDVARGAVTVFIAHILFCVSYVVVTVKARTSGLGRDYEEAAQDLGAAPWTTFWTVTFPMIFPGIMAASLLAAALSIDDYVITSFNAGPFQTFPLWVYGASRIGVPPQVNVMGSILFMVGVVSVVISLLRARRVGAAPPLLDREEIRPEAPAVR
jgi:spermidine/putrescine transport system permease protein